MNKVYIIFPLLGILIFGGFYMSFDKSYAEKLVAIKTKAENEKKDKALKLVKDRDVAIKAAIEATAQRAKERKEREAIEEAKKVARQEAEDRRQRTHEDVLKFRDQVARLKRDLVEVKEVSAKIAMEKKAHADELGFLKTYVKQAESNVKYYYDLLDKVTAAEKAAADAAAAAAAAAKKS